MPGRLRPNDLVTSAAASLFDGTETVLLSATQPVPTRDQEATIIIATVVDIAAD